MDWKSYMERHVVMLIDLLQKQVDRTLSFLDTSGQEENISDISHIEEIIDEELLDIYNHTVSFLTNENNENAVLAILVLLELSIKLEESSDLMLSTIRMLREIQAIPPNIVLLMRQMLDILKEAYGDLHPLSAPFKLRPEQRDMVIDIQYRQITEVIKDANIPRTSMIMLGRISRHIELLGDTAKDAIKLKQIYLSTIEKLT